MNVVYKMLNIRGLDKKRDDDIFFRYKMHKPVIKEQKNNKIFENIAVISKELNRDIKILIKYIKIKIGANIIYKNNIVTLPKNITDEQILEAIYQYIDEYILCPKCQLPETVIEQDNMQCKCCSFSGKIK